MLLSFTGFSQGMRHKLYLNGMMKETIASQHVYTLELIAVDTDTFEGVIKDKNNIIKAKGGYIRENKQFLQHGYFQFYYPDGETESEGNYDRGVKVGSWLRFTEDGTQKPDRYYDPKSAELVRSAMNGQLSQ